MKTLFTFFLSLYILPVALSAQPVISNNEFYHVGDIISMVNCDPSGVSAGPAGAAAEWDFSSIHATTGTSSTFVLNDTSSVFLTSNLLLVLPNGSLEYMQENSSDSYIWGIYDTPTYTTTYYNNYDVSRRPFTYLTVDTSSYSMEVLSTATTGVGHLTQTGDAYGTLKLPTGTFSNVLRIKKVQNEIDTTGTNIVTTTTVSYLWFDTTHAAPLFRLDSVIGVIGYGQKAMYLSLPTGLPNYNSNMGSYTGHLDNNELLLTGPFERSLIYDVVVYDLIGNKVLSYEFTASGNSQRFQNERQLDAGIYIVRITQKANQSATQAIKVIKQ